LQSYYNYAFKINDELLVYDVPANNRRTLVMNVKIRNDFSTLPIRYVVLFHNHFDHTGGWRGALAEGGDLVVGSGSQAAMQDIMQNQHQVLANPLQHMFKASCFIKGEFYAK
jgi:metal-dependent hydrolase (beta-lactamase superfamily II)